MNHKDNKLIQVCSECKKASCWYGEWLCIDSRKANIELMTIKELKILGLENEEQWSDVKMIKVYGESAPFGYKGNNTYGSCEEKIVK